mmetsp:Transcript_55407/g.159317  ORF Transcript_55407/g.159317 Transcript_55407/m.159317 type:complete len:308 (+) Transcript_55407:672-1595(+)
MAQCKRAGGGRAFSPQSELLVASVRGDSRTIALCRIQGHAAQGLLKTNEGTSLVLCSFQARLQPLVHVVALVLSIVLGLDFVLDLCDVTLHKDGIVNVLRIHQLLVLLQFGLENLNLASHLRLLCTVLLLHFVEQRVRQLNVGTCCLERFLDPFFVVLDLFTDELEEQVVFGLGRRAPLIAVDLRECEALLGRRQPLAGFLAVALQPSHLDARGQHLRVQVAMHLLLRLQLRQEFLQLIQDCVQDQPTGILLPDQRVMVQLALQQLFIIGCLGIFQILHNRFHVTVALTSIQAFLVQRTGARQSLFG